MLAADLDVLCRELAAAPPPSAVSAAARRGQGVVFTPAPLARYVAAQVLAPLRGRGRPLVVLDPAAGDGALLAAAAAELGPGHHLIGLERDPALAAALRARVPTAEVHVCEALLAAPPLPPVDAVLGNPPYVRSIRLRAADPALWQAVRGAFAATRHGEWDLYAAFLERAPAWLAPGGRFGLIVPSRWMTARTAAGLRQHLAEAGVVRAILDFGPTQIFAAATTYAAVVIGERGAAPPPTIAVRRHDGVRWHAVTIERACWGAAPWLAAVGDATLVTRWAGRGPTLGEVARIAKGAGSNADPVFVLDDATVEGALVRGRSGGEVVEVEAALTWPLRRGRDVVAWAAPVGAAEPRALLPYAPPYRTGDLVPWPTLARDFPRAAAHLDRHRARLAGRERGRFAGACAHAWGRPQNLGFLLDRAPKIIVPDVLATARAELDLDGRLVLDSAYAVRPRPGGPIPIEVLLALLNAPVVRTWLDHHSVPLRGGFTRLKTAALAPMPVPAPGPWIERVRRAVVGGDHAAAVAAIGAAYAVAPGARTA